MTPPVPFEELTEFQRRTLANGCGPSSVPMRPPQFDFGDACERHDYTYAVGGTELDRVEADRAFLVAMHEAANRTWWPRRVWLRWVADRYYHAVRRYGRGSWRSRDPWMKPPTLAELMLEAKR